MAPVQELLDWYRDLFEWKARQSVPVALARHELGMGCAEEWQARRYASQKGGESVSKVLQVYAVRSFIA